MAILSPYAEERMGDVRSAVDRGNSEEKRRLALSLQGDLAVREISDAEYQEMVALLNKKKK